MALVHFKMKIIILLLESCVREEIKAFGYFCPLFRPVKAKEFCLYMYIQKDPIHKVKICNVTSAQITQPQA